MALSKSIEVANTGVNATYWVLERVEFRLIGGTTFAQLNGYLSSAAYAGGKAKLTERGFTAPTPGGFATMTGTQMVQSIYDYVKTQSEFSGATDVA